MNAFAQFARKSLTSSSVNAAATRTSSNITKPTHIAFNIPQCIPKRYDPKLQPACTIVPHGGSARENSCADSDVVQDWRLDEAKIKSPEEVPLVTFIERGGVFRAFAEMKRL